MTFTALVPLFIHMMVAILKWLIATEDFRKRTYPPLWCKSSRSYMIYDSITGAEKATHQTMCWILDIQNYFPARNGSCAVIVSRSLVIQWSKKSWRTTYFHIPAVRHEETTLVKAASFDGSGTYGCDPIFWLGRQYDEDCLWADIMAEQPLLSIMDSHTTQRQHRITVLSLCRMGITVLMDPFVLP